MANIANPNIAAIVLAAGASRRFGEGNKLASVIGGRTLLARVVGAARASQAMSVTVVVSPESGELLAEFTGTGTTIVVNDDTGSGLSRSLALGLEAQSDTVEGAVILLADMPFVSAGIIDALMSSFSGHRECIVVPVSAGRRGNPILWPARFFSEMKRLSGDRGARALLDVYAHCVAEVEINDEAIFTDVDTREVLGEVGGCAGPVPGA